MRTRPSLRSRHPCQKDETLLRPDPARSDASVPVVLLVAVQARDRGHVRFRQGKAEEIQILADVFRIRRPLMKNAPNLPVRRAFFSIQERDPSVNAQSVVACGSSSSSSRFAGAGALRAASKRARYSSVTSFAT